MKGFLGDAIDGCGVGDDNLSWGLDQNGKLKHNGLNVASFSNFNPLDHKVIGCLLDLQLKAISFYLPTGDSLSVALPSSVKEIFFPSLSLCSAPYELQVNFGEWDFALSLPDNSRSIHSLVNEREREIH